MNEQPRLFEVVSEREFKQEQPQTTKRKASRKVNIAALPRTRANWLSLAAHMDYCTVPAHEEIQRTLDPEALEYRQRYPTRFCVDIDGTMVCRDCWLMGEPNDG